MNKTTEATPEEAKNKTTGESGGPLIAPLMVYFAAGLQGLTAMASLLFVKELLSLTAENIAGVTFWLTLPWSMKIVFGEIADHYWRHKVSVMGVGIGLVAISNIFIIGLIQFPDAFGGIEARGGWYCFLAILAPLGFVIQDVVADGMTVEVAAATDGSGKKKHHGQIQALGRIAFLLGMLLTWCVNIFIFGNQENLSIDEKADLYSLLYSIGLLGPCLAGLGLLAALRSPGNRPTTETAKTFDMKLFAGCLVYVTTLIILQTKPFFASSLISIAVTILGTTLMIVHLLRGQLKDRLSYHEFAATGIILWAFNATPDIGPGLQWWQIDKLGFDPQFLSMLNFVGTLLALLSLISMARFRRAEFRNMGATIVILTCIKACLFVPDLCLYYGLHTQFSDATGFPISARAVSIADIAFESQLTQVAAVPVLVWVANNAPRQSMAVFFAAATSLINSSTQCKMLLTQLLNGVYVVSREVNDGVNPVSGDYSMLGSLMQIVFMCNLLIPLTAVILVSVLIPKKRS